VNFVRWTEAGKSVFVLTPTTAPPCAAHRRRSPSSERRCSSKPSDLF
jgi:hypothetical protein